LLARATNHPFVWGGGGGERKNYLNSPVKHNRNISNTMKCLRLICEDKTIKRALADPYYLSGEESFSGSPGFEIVKNKFGRVLCNPQVHNCVHKNANLGGDLRHVNSLQIPHITSLRLVLILSSPPPACTSHVSSDGPHM